MTIAVRGLGLSLAFGLVAWLLNGYVFQGPRPTGPPPRKVSREELSLASSENATHVYVSLLGHVFDVSKGRSYYGKGGGYAFFAGRDATRAFATGDFSSEGLQESIEGLSSPECLAIKKWLAFYRGHRKYDFVGFLEGNVYVDADAGVGKTSLAAPAASAADTRETAAMRQFQACARSGATLATDEKQRATCSSEWNLQTGIRKVWCDAADMVPRKASFMMSNGATKEECMCIPLQQISERRDVLPFGDCNEREAVCTYSAAP